ncbi:hypothetical protein Tco_0820986 [Tanacetum coccineum]|uniref:Uncharacterized protein n=1 Tax=Tanacetum coccineum TaxID=301880 RepID=A0ABQ5AE54_9ASTR
MPSTPGGIESSCSRNSSISSIRKSLPPKGVSCGRERNDCKASWLSLWNIYNGEFGPPERKTGKEVDLVSNHLRSVTGISLGILEGILSLEVPPASGVQCILIFGIRAYRMYRVDAILDKHHGWGIPLRRSLNGPITMPRKTSSHEDIDSRGLFFKKIRAASPRRENWEEKHKLKPTYSGAVRELHCRSDLVEIRMGNFLGNNDSHPRNPRFGEFNRRFGLVVVDVYVLENRCAHATK